MEEQQHQQNVQELQQIEVQKQQHEKQQQELQEQQQQTFQDQQEEPQKLDEEVGYKIESTQQMPKKAIEGRRIIDISFFLKQLRDLDNHSNFGCNFSSMELISEQRKGLISGFKFKCRMCNVFKTVWSEDIDCPSKNVNTDAVSGIMAIGCGYNNLEEFFTIMDIKPMSNKLYTKEHEKVCDAWEIAALKEMELAIEEEKALAVARGDVDQDGVPLLTVEVDGSWAKRSYRSNFSSLSGAVSKIIVCFFTY